MKRNLLLYILLLFLIIVNGFFLYNYLGNPDKEQQQEARKPPGAFLMDELGFSNSQKDEFRVLTREHRQRIRGISDEIRQLKDELFSGLSDTSSRGADTDSIATLIGKNEAAKDLEVLRHFKQVEALCKAQQKEKFRKIIHDALKRGGRDQRPPRGVRPNDRPPRPRDREGNRPPPLH
ncbi:hypothetical protein [uncultured Algibacter sp.]|uniref:hypothetical protein n=1 Tax=uncultured Algibacter sp. TaxID=298659 RepID=UPI00261EC656|nr:hypothetical protein [uncultured Algibacter sp.]